MTTREMYNRGLRCKSRGGYCVWCKEGNECAEYSKEKKINDIKLNVIKRLEEGHEIPVELIKAYNDIIEQIKYNS